MIYEPCSKTLSWILMTKFLESIYLNDIFKQSKLSLTIWAAAPNLIILFTLFRLVMRYYWNKRESEWVRLNSVWMTRTLPNDFYVVRSTYIESLTLRFYLTNYIPKLKLLRMQNNDLSGHVCFLSLYLCASINSNENKTCFLYIISVKFKSTVPT